MCSSVIRVLPGRSITAVISNRSSPASTCMPGNKFGLISDRDHVAVNFGPTLADAAPYPEIPGGNRYFSNNCYSVATRAKSVHLITVKRL